MLITLFDANHISTLLLPEKINGRYWLYGCSENGTKERLLSVEAVRGKWQAKSNRKVKMLDTEGKPQPLLWLEEGKNYRIRLAGRKAASTMIAEKISPERQVFLKYTLPENQDILIGRGEGCTIQIQNQMVSTQHTLLRYRGGQWSLLDQNSTNGTYVNGIKVSQMNLHYGDTIYIMGIRLIVGCGILAVNTASQEVLLSPSVFARFQRQEIFPTNQEVDLFEEEEAELTGFFFRSPRFKREIQPPKLEIDPPPSPQEPDRIPLALMLGPSLTMGMVSMATAAVTVSNIVSGTVKAGNAVTSLLMSLSMMLSCVLWPTLTKRHERKRQEEAEALRQERYMLYLQQMSDSIAQQCSLQEAILRENSLSPTECYNRILSHTPSLWERTIGQEDFLSLRLGNGVLPLAADLKFPDKHFEVQQDNLRFALYSLADEPKMLNNVPITLSLTENPICGIIGSKEQSNAFLYNLILQIAALHGYDEVKLILLCDEKEAGQWQFLRWLPHLWSDDRTIRFYAANNEEAQTISSYLEPILAARAAEEASYTETPPYYIFLALNRNLLNCMEAANLVLHHKTNLGAGVIAVSDAVWNLPKECSRVVELGNGQAALYDKNDLSGKRQNFIPEYCRGFDMQRMAENLSDLRLRLGSETYTMPDMLTFLEMFQVGNIEHLNILNRWKENDPTKTLRAPVGVNTDGSLFYLDLHEKVHGPHGLVAGMTGSGKSEFIISYILSLAVNYHPDEVAFILIDYKGGGLAGAFDDPTKGIHLPHLAGTITNLDGASVNRSLISIQSELRRRQMIFNNARRISNEGTMDIYKYQRLRREGVVQEAVPHLLIISDEFAELKQQQPDFMEQLISAARIGRSLGVHLILATQKPNGIVNDQIWSNCRFRVCLKVQDKADSMDMINRPDAASLSQTGRFFLQVGFNEYFALGQSAWCGAPYIPTETVEKKVDNSVCILDNVGRVVAECKPSRTKEAGNHSVKQIVSIVENLSQIADAEHIAVRKLWLEPIPAKLRLEELQNKYGFTQSPYLLEAVVGEYDDPFNQTQGLLTVPLSREGNVIVYGSTDSGSDIFLSTFIYSLLREHSAKELNLYILDFGAELLTCFARAPQVGEVLVSGDTEKLQKLFKMLLKEIEKRRRKLSALGMDYAGYCRSYSDMPNLVVVINDYSGLVESFESVEEYLGTLTREGLRTGLYFVLSGSASNAIRYRITQNFKQMFVLQLNDRTEYSAILGNTGGVFPSQLKGRGIFKKGNCYEFQTAYVFEEENENRLLRAACEELRKNSTDRVEKIPVLPNVVELPFVQEAMDGLNAVPVGVATETIKIQSVNLRNHQIYPILAQDSALLRQFGESLLSLFSLMEDVSVTVLDPFAKFSRPVDSSIKLIQQDFEAAVVELFREMVTRNNTFKDAGSRPEVLEQFPEQVYFIFGTKELLSRLSADGKDKLKVLLEKGEAIYRLRFLLLEEAGALRSINYDNWYTRHVNGKDGIWLGNGFGEQYLLRPATSGSFGKPIGNSFGYVMTDGRPVLAKMLGMKEKEADS